MESLIRQTVKPQEVVVADGSGGDSVAEVVADPMWPGHGIATVRIEVLPPNAVQQREEAIRLSRGNLLLLLDDDVELEAACLEELLTVLSGAPGVAAVVADFSNQAWARPTRAWRTYLSIVHGRTENQCQGRVLGPLLRFGYFDRPAAPAPMEWLGTGSTLLRRTAFDRSGGFSTFFLHRCAINEDVDLGIKISRVGQILLCPSARLAHFHAPSGRVSVQTAAEDDVYNRAFVLRRTLRRTAPAALCLVALFVLIESCSNLLGAAKRRTWQGVWAPCHGRLRGLFRASFARSMWTSTLDSGREK